MSMIADGTGTPEDANGIFDLLDKLPSQCIWISNKQLFISSRCQCRSGK